VSHASASIASVEKKLELIKFFQFAPTPIYLLHMVAFRYYPLTTTQKPTSPTSSSTEPEPT
jgi:hypothetical protein